MECRLHSIGTQLHDRPSLPLAESRRDRGFLGSDTRPSSSSFPLATAVAAPSPALNLPLSNLAESLSSPLAGMELWKGDLSDYQWVGGEVLEVGGETVSLNNSDSMWAKELEFLQSQLNGTKEARRDDLFDTCPNPAGVLTDSKDMATQDHTNRLVGEHEVASNLATLSLEETLDLLDQIDSLPLIETIVCILHKFQEKKNLVFAKCAYVYICRYGLESHVSVGDHIVPMFAECGGLSEARKAFNRLAHHNEHVWKSLIFGYIQCGKVQLALNVYQDMVDDDIAPSSYTLVMLLQAFVRLKDFRKGAELHADIVQIGLEKDTFVGTTLVHFYANCGLLSEARDVFDELPCQGIASWNALIAGYAEHGTSQEVFECIQRMQLEDVTPNAITYSCSLKVCCNASDIGKVQRLHLQIAQDGYENDHPVANSMIGMYAKCGSILEAQDVFDSLPYRNVISWNALMTGYADHGLDEDVLNLYEKMPLEGILPDGTTYSCTLRACGEAGTIDRGQAMHKDIVQAGLETHLSVGNGLIGIYGKFGLLSEANEVFTKMSARDVVTWTALIGGYAEHGADEEAIKQFEQMQKEGVFPDAVTYTCILKAYGNMKDIGRGRELSREIALKGLWEDPCIGNTSLGMYVRCGSLLEAREFFDGMPTRNIVTWTTLITGFADNGNGQEALEIFKQIQSSGIPPNTVTLTAALKACASIGALEKGQEIHVDVTQKGLEDHEMVCSSLVCMYAKCGLLDEALELTHELPLQNVVWWNALLSGYVEYGTGREAMEWFKQMGDEGVLSDAVTYSAVLKACGMVGALDMGQAIHREIVQRGMEEDSSIGNSLISMYAKCGSLSEAHEVFKMLKVQDVVAWSSMIIGYGVNHDGLLAMQCFDDMQKHGVKPDSITFMRLLTACSHAGLVSEGFEYLKNMREGHGISPTDEHFTSMVDIHARSGHLYEAEQFIQMLCPRSDVLWGALLSACKTYGEAQLGLRCFDQLVELNPKAASWYVLIADICASTGRRDTAHRIEELRKHAGTVKKRGSALIEVDKKLHEFMVGDEQDIEVLDKLMALSLQVKEQGHRPHLAQVLKPMSDEDKEESLCEHAEKLAIAFGLLNTPQGQTLRISKNLRMCGDCHNASKIISKIERRNIVLKDECCMHHFKDGECSCGDMF